MNKSVVWPNFFIGGAPKCGTTALYYYLKDHPNIFLPTLKEPHYWCEDLPGLRKHKTLSEYLELFDSSTSKHLAIGDASATYLFSKVAFKKIFEKMPDAKIIIMLRNPVDMVYSLHSELLYNCNEDVKDFETAWFLQDQRKKGGHIPSTCREPQMLQYFNWGENGRHLSRLYDIFPRHQIKVILFDDFKKSVSTIYKEVLQFLDLPDDNRTEFPVINMNRTLRNRSVAEFMINLPKPIRFASSKVKQLLGIKYWVFIPHLYSLLNVRKRNRSPLPLRLRQTLQEQFKSDIDLLSRLLDRDLSYWYKN